jgi:hypothetical protein
MVIVKDFSPLESYISIVKEWVNTIIIWYWPKSLQPKYRLIGICDNKEKKDINLKTESFVLQSVDEWKWD